MKKISTLIILLTCKLSFSQDILINNTNNKWILHAPDDGRTFLTIATSVDNVWQWGAATQFLRNGGAVFNGSIGIGTNSPIAKLHVNNGDNSFGSILANATESSFSLYTKTLSTNPFSESFRLGLKYLDNENNSFISFYRGGNVAGGFLGFSTNGQERIRISDVGNVGIGTPNPTAKFEVLNSLETNGNEIIASLKRSGTTTGGSSIVRFGYHSTCDFEVNSGYSNAAQRFGDYFDLNITNNHTGGSHGGINFATNASVKMAINVNGNVGIGTTVPDEKLTVKGKIHTQEVRVDLLGPLVPDYVFANDYKLKTLQEVEEYIKQNSHLPEIPSAKEIEKNGLMLAEMNMSLLKKIEELTLYSIDQNKKIEMQSKQIQTQSKEIDTLKELVLRVTKIESELARK